MWKTISGEEHIEISRLGGWIDSVTDDLMGFIHTPVVRSCGLEKLQMIDHIQPRIIHCKLEKSKHYVMNFLKAGQSLGILENQESECHAQET